MSERTFDLSREDFEMFLFIVEEHIIDREEMGEDCQQLQAYYDYLRDEYGHSWSPETGLESYAPTETESEMIRLLNDVVRPENYDGALVGDIEAYLRRHGWLEGAENDAQD